MERSQRDLFIDMVVDGFILKNDQITLSLSSYAKQVQDCVKQEEVL